MAPAESRNMKRRPLATVVPGRKSCMNGIVSETAPGKAQNSDIIGNILIKLPLQG
jgi:hypothetical protein